MIRWFLTLRQTMMADRKLTRSSVDSAVTHPGSAPLTRGVEARWLPRAVAALRRPGDTVWPRSATRSSIAPSRLDTKFKLHALYDNPLSLYPGLHRIFYDGDYDELRRTLLFFIVIGCPSCFPTP